MTFTVEQREIRLDRAITFFGHDIELCRIITDNACDKTAEELTTDDLQERLEEGVWPLRLLRKITDKTTDSELRTFLLSRFLKAIYNLEKMADDFFAWSVDHSGNGWAAVWTRTIDRLDTFSRENKYFDENLTAEEKGQIREAVMSYNFGEEGIETRRATQKKTDAEFQKIFGADRYQEVREAVVQPLTGIVTPKHLFKFIVEIPDPEKQRRCMELYVEAIEANPDLELSKTLIAKYRENVEKFSDEYEGELPEALLEIGRALR